ncbi:helix-turn-helix domain-containing protein [Actinotalea ferrariae]|uniref:helix-turn-helix domain-containing protein n=1 Tax=Actinotalea ferrariae TaxID=1386098 RepID=UPI0035ABB551
MNRQHQGVRREPVRPAGYGRTSSAGVRPGARSTVPAVPGPTGTEGGRPMVVLRREIGDVLRGARQRQGRTLREVSSAARVSLGYLSEVERGQKEASSELLGSICDALDVPLSLVLREVSDRVAVAEGLTIPDTVPVDLTSCLRDQGGSWSQRGELAPVG